MPAARRYHHGNLRRALLDAALALFAARGRFDFTMRELARAAGVTHNAPYRHFADRWALLDTLAAEGFVRMRNAMAAAAAAGDDNPRAAIARAGEAYVRFARDHPHHFRLMYLRPPDDDDPELAAARRASFAVLEAAVQQAHARGLIRGELRPQDVSVAAWSMVHGVAALLIGGHLSARALRRRMQAMIAVFSAGVFVS